MKLSKNGKGKTIQTQGGRKYVRQKTVTVRIRLTPELTEEMLRGGWSGGGGEISHSHTSSLQGSLFFFTFVLFGSYFQKFGQSVYRNIFVEPEKQNKYLCLKCLEKKLSQRGARAACRAQVARLPRQPSCTQPQPPVGKEESPTFETGAVKAH